MDIITVEARYTKKISLPQKFIESLPQEITLFTTVQYKDSLKKIQQQLQEQQKKVHLVQPRHCAYKGQLLGCSTQTLPIQGECVYIGDGLFHPKALLLRNTTKIHTFNPKTNDSAILDKKAIEPILKKLKGMYARFLTAKKVGVLLTLKPGQYKPQLASTLEKKYPHKQFYFFIDNTYNFASLADFSFIDMFLNTMCERIGLDDMNEQEINVLNVEDLFDLEKGVFD